jgi:hypothetical protein
MFEVGLDPSLAVESGDIIMANALRSSADPRAAPPLAANSNAVNPLLDLNLANAVIAAVLGAQRQQWEMLLNWQKSFAEWQQDAWDQWISHWGGGVPIDA